MENIPLERWSLSRKGHLSLTIRIPSEVLSDSYTTVRILIAQREDGMGEWTPESEGIQQFIDVKALDEHGKYQAEIDLATLQWHDARWDVIALVGEKSQPIEDQTPFELKCTAKQRRQFYKHAFQAYLPGNTIVIPYLTGRRTFALIYRERTWYDSPWYLAKEVAAWFTYRAFKKSLEAKRIWIVYEKQCERAQDNGFYFFKYCMENLPPEERKRIFFVIDPHSTDYERVKPYSSNVLKFMSYRQFLYCIAAEMLVGSETKIHLSPVRSRPGYTKHKLAKTMTFFLQHGVMAFKRTDKRMGATGWHPVDYFLVSSEREQDVITGSFGYDAEHVPVLGQARWDALEDHSDPAAPKILLMPTWREWLSNDSEEEFMQTDFYQSYQQLLNDPALEECLAEHNATLQVFLHPLFLHLSHLFNSKNEHVQILQPDDAPLNQIIMGCSAMVTDYSSAVWDAVYQGKPALFFHFDRPLYMEKTGSYIDFETELPGDCYMDAQSLIDGLRKTIEGGFVPSEQQEASVARWYAHRDKNNCKRIYECALEIERTLK